MFGSNVESNVLMSFWPTDLLMTIVRILYAVTILGSYIVMLYPVRSNILNWFHLDLTTKKGNKAFYIVSVILVIVTVGISIAFGDITVVMNVFSAVFGCAMYWVLPIALIYVHPNMTEKINQEKA